MPSMLAVDPLGQAQTDLQLASDVIRALVIRLGGEVVVTKDDLFVASRGGMEWGPVVGGGLAMRVVLPAVIPDGPMEFSL